MDQITIEAPCKINLALDIVRRLPNGYHEMDMVMQTVGLYDTLTLSLHPGRPQITMSCTVESGATLACDETNIAVRCANAFFKESGIPLSGRLHIDLLKRIPMMAGLGGGSADGAGVLAGLNRLTDAQLPPNVLEQIGLSVGADIPFCLRGGTQRAQGIGEVFSALPSMPDCPIVIIKPRFGISTRAAFARCDNAPYPHADVEKMVSALSCQKVEAIAGAMQNVFEELCSDQERTQLDQCRQLLLEHGALGALLSGSGSALFGLFDSDSCAKRSTVLLKGHPLLEGAFLCRPVSSGAFSI